MSKNTFIFLPFILLSIFTSTPGVCLKNDAIILLKKAAISDQTIELIIREKIIETCAFTLQEILDLKRARISDKTIQMIIKEGSFMKFSEPIVYGKDIRPIKFTTVKDIVKLKHAGVSDEIIQAIIIYESKDSSDIDREKAWDMLRNMGIILDGRRHNPPHLPGSHHPD
jgi:hypothetical protein